LPNLQQHQSPLNQRINDSPISDISTLDQPMTATPEIFSQTSSVALMESSADTFVKEPIAVEKSISPFSSPIFSPIRPGSKDLMFHKKLKVDGRESSKVDKGDNVLEFQVLFLLIFCLLTSIYTIKIFF
jgi:hypothetical protein